MLNTIVTAADVQDRDGERGCSAHYSVSTFPAEAVCRWRLSGTGVPRLRQSRASKVSVEIVKRSDRVKRFMCCQTLGRGENACLAEPLSTPEQRLGEPQPQGGNMIMAGGRFDRPRLEIDKG